MQEYFSDAIVLDRLANGDVDSRVVLFTKHFGKLFAKAKSARKITSKLSAHLEPGNLIRVRLVEKNGLQVADALKQTRLRQTPADFHFLGRLLAEAEPEMHIWNMLIGGNFSWRNTLNILGWSSDGVNCAACSRAPAAFHLQTQEFFCHSCALRIPKDEVVYIS